MNDATSMRELINCFFDAPFLPSWPDFFYGLPSVRIQANNRQVKWAYVWYEHVKMRKGTRHKRCPKLRNITRHIAEAKRRGILVDKEPKS